MSRTEVGSNYEVYKVNTASLNTNRLWAYLQLMRPANIVTSWADVLAGFAASGALFLIPLGIEGQALLASLTLLIWLLVATTGLYGGGVVFNDVFDAKLDARERTERPIPSGRASREGAALLASLLLVVGVAAATQVSWLSATLAASISAAALLYDAVSKHDPLLGPLNMGLCRGFNLLLGISVVPGMVGKLWFLALISIIYIAAVTTLSRGEVYGAKVLTRIVSLLLVGVVIAGLLGLGLLEDYQFLAALPLMVLFVVQVWQPMKKATCDPSPEQVRIAVKTGVLSLIILDATITAGFASFPYGLLVLCLLPISMLLAQMFAVT